VSLMLIIHSYSFTLYDLFLSNRHLKIFGMYSIVCGSADVSTIYMQT